MDFQEVTGRFQTVLEQTNETTPVLGRYFEKTLIVDRERETIKIKFGSFVNTVVRIQGCDSLMIVGRNQDNRSVYEEEKDIIENVFSMNLGRMHNVEDFTAHMHTHHGEYTADHLVLTEDTTDQLKPLIKETIKLFMKRMLIKQLKQERTHETHRPVFRSALESVHLTYKLLKREISMANFEELNDSMERAFNNLIIWEQTIANLLEKEEFCGRCILKNKNFCFH